MSKFAIELLKGDLDGLGCCMACGKIYYTKRQAKECDCKEPEKEAKEEVKK